MPHSSPLFDGEIAEVVKLTCPRIFLDLGAGAGKYGLVAKGVDRSIKTIAVEVERDYIEKFDLKSIYNQVWNISVTELIRPEYLDSNFDVVLLGDVLEHLKKSEGIDLLNFLIYRCRWIIVKFPHRYLQSAVDGHVSEAHVSVWSENDFLSFERTKMYVKDTQRLIVLRGYHEDRISIKEVNLILGRV